MAAQVGAVSRTRQNLVVDLLLFVSFLLLMNPHSTGMAIHEWLGIAAGATIILHLLLHWQWMAVTARKIVSKLPWRTRVNALLNILLFVCFTVMMLSGLLISESALPLLGITVQGGGAWKQLHTLSADLGLLIVAAHVGLHWGWIVSAFKNYVWQPVKRMLRRRPRSATPALEVNS